MARSDGRLGHGAIFAYCRSKSVVADLADLDRADDPVAVDEVGLRPAGDPIGGLERLVRVLDRRPGRAVVSWRTARPARRVVGQDADDGQTVVGVLGLLVDEQRELVAAGDARRTPEVDDDRAPGVVGQVERLAVEGRPDDRPAPDLSRPARSCVVGEGPDDHHTPTVVTRAMTRARRSGRRGRDGTSGGPPYLRWPVPVMFGWTVQMNVYARRPAAAARRRPASPRR